MSNIHFYRCESCGIIAYAFGEQALPGLKELVPNTVDASGEKHVPVVTFVGDKTIKIEVGSVAHPMLPEHHISFVYVETERGGIRVNLTDKPEAIVYLGDERPVAVYEYCNLHGLWKVEL